jgi:hypothetical protein
MSIHGVSTRPLLHCSQSAARTNQRVPSPVWPAKLASTSLKMIFLDTKLFEVHCRGTKQLAAKGELLCTCDRPLL